MKVEPADLSDRGWDPSEDVDAEPANDEREITEAEVDWRDSCGRLLACVVGFNEATAEVEWLDAWDENGNKVELSYDEREVIARKALA
jgi:hypothetical protein